MSAVTATWILLGVAVVIAQVRHMRVVELLSEYWDEGLKSSMIIFFLAFLFTNGWFKSFGDPAFQELWNKEGKIGELFRSIVKTAVLTGALKGILFTLTLLGSIVFAPLLLGAAAGVELSRYLKGGANGFLHYASTYSNWLFDGFPAWIIAWYPTAHLTLAALLTLRGWRPTSVGILSFGRLRAALLDTVERRDRNRGPAVEDEFWHHRQRTAAATSSDLVIDVERNEERARNEREQERVLALLDKMASKGLSSLTSEEQQFLQSRAENRRLK
jgi:hypothetical protein